MDERSANSYVSGTRGGPTRNRKREPLSASSSRSDSPAVGIVAEDRSLAERTREILLESDVPVAFDLAPSEFTNGKMVAAADVVVLAVSLESRDEALLRRVQDGRSEQLLVVCTEPVETSTLRWALYKGVDGVVWDTRLDDSLELTIRAVNAGQLVFPSTFRRRFTLPDLTNREKQVLSLVVMGLTNREIAEKLFISDSTVKSHLNTAYRKLGVSSRVEAAELITDPEEGLGTGILAITASGHARRR